MLVDNGLAQRILSNPGVLLVAGLTLIALIAERSLLAAGTLTGGALTPAWGGVSGLWHEYLQGFHPAGIGSASSTPPYVAVHRRAGHGARRQALAGHRRHHDRLRSRSPGWPPSWPPAG